MNPVTVALIQRLVDRLQVLIRAHSCSKFVEDVQVFARFIIDDPYVYNDPKRVHYALFWLLIYAEDALRFTYEAYPSEIEFLLSVLGQASSLLKNKTN